MEARIIPWLASGLVGALLAPAHATEPGPASDEAGALIVVEADGRLEGEGTASLTVIPVDERLARDASVAGVLERVAGARVLSLGGLGDFSAVGIRGSSLRQVQVFIDGIPLNPDGQQVVNLAELPLLAFQRVEVYRGGAPARFAAAPIGGVVNLVTPERREAAPSLLQVSAGQLGSARMDALQAGGGDLGAVPVDALAFAEVFSTRGDFRYFSDNGTPYNLTDDSRPQRANNDKDQLTAHGRLRLGQGPLRFTLLDAFLSRDEGLPGHANAPAGATRMQTTRNLVVGQVDGQQGQGRLTGQAWWQQRAETLDDRLGEVGLGEQWSRYGFRSLGGLLYGARALGPQLVPALTLSLRQDQVRTDDLLAERAAPDRRRLSGTLAASAEIYAWQDRLRLSPVLQGQLLDNRALGSTRGATGVAGQGARDVSGAFTPRLGLRLQPWAPLALRANGGRYLRPPDFSELFGDRGVLVGNPDLRPERGWQGDVGAIFTLPERRFLSASLDVGHYWSAVEDQIIFVQNGQRTSVPVNFGQTFTRGLEAALELSVWGLLDSSSSLTLTHSENRVQRPEVFENQLPRLPRQQAFQATSVHWRDHLRVGHTWSYVAGNYWDATNFYPSPPRNLHGAFARVRPLSGVDLSLEASVLNLLDRSVEIVDRNPLDPADDARALQPVTDFVGYPLPGRTWMFSLRWVAQAQGAP